MFDFTRPPAHDPMPTLVWLDGAYHLICPDCREPVIPLHQYAIGLDCPPPCPHCPPVDWSAATVEISANPPASPSG